MGRPRSYVREDDRDAEQRREMPFLIVGMDKFLSGWGGAADGVSVAAWACREEDIDRVFKWVKARSDMRRVRLVDEREHSGVWPCKSVFPRCVHFHIYAVTPGRPALAGHGA
jgi:hypothetical protein